MSLSDQAGIVAGRPPSADGLTAVRGRTAWAVLWLLILALLGLARALSEPSIGHRLAWVEGKGVVAWPGDDRSQGLQGVTAVWVHHASGRSERLPLDARVMAETGGLALYYREQGHFYAEHARFWEALRAAREGVAWLQLEHAQGLKTLAVRPKRLSELGPRFWVPWAVGLLALSVGMAVWVYRSVDGAAVWYALASLAYAFWMAVVVAPTSARLWTQHAASFQALHWLAHAASYLYLIGLCMLLWRFPSSLDRPGLRRGGVLAALLIWSSVFSLVDAMAWVETISVGFRLPNLVPALLLLGLYVAQWRRAHERPLHRAQLKWLGLLLGLTLAVPFVAVLFASVNRYSPVPMAYGMTLFSLIFLGFVPLVTRLRMFELEAWWPRAWLWFLGGLLVVLLDVALLLAWPLAHPDALTLAVALAGWVYFPLRQALWRRLSASGLPTMRDVLPEVVALVTETLSVAPARSARWARVWELQFQPLRLESQPAGTQVEEAVQIVAGGEALQVPAVGGLPGLVLHLPMRGTRLFNPQDLRRSQEIVALVRHAIEAREAHARGAQEERQRIAADLHDDLGAKLLTIAQSSRGATPEAERVSRLARQALDDMRLSVRGLTAPSAPLAEVLADWRAETVQRLDDAGIEAVWEAQAVPPEVMLPARTEVQLTRVLREAVSNTIRHSGARCCRVHLAYAGGRLTLVVEDDGVGLPARVRPGQGLPNIERRARKLGGEHRVGTGTMGGVEVRVEVPVGVGP